MDNEFTTLLKAAKAIVSAGKNPDEIETLMKLQDRLYELTFENKDLKEEVRVLKEQLEARQKLEIKGEKYYIKEENGNLTGPICPNCYTEKGIVCTLRENNLHGSDQFYQCMTCNNYFNSTTKYDSL